MSDLLVSVDVGQLKRDVSINDTDLTSAMMSQSALFVHYAQLCAQAQRQMDRAKITVELKEAKAHKRLTQQARDNEEKVVEAALNKAIMRDSDVLQAKIRYADTKMVHALSKEALEAFKQRKDMLVQIGVSAREEMKGDMRIKEIQAEASTAELKKQGGRDAIGKGVRKTVECV